jgi:MFS family permease
MAALLASLPFLALGFMSSSLPTAVPLLMIGAFCLGAAGPPGDAAGLDIIHPHLWGRSEGIRTFLRALLQATGPVAFGFASEHLPGANSGGQPGLEYTFVLFLAVLVLAGLAILPALRTYPATSLRPTHLSTPSPRPPGASDRRKPRYHLAAARPRPRRRHLRYGSKPDLAAGQPAQVKAPGQRTRESALDISLWRIARQQSVGWNGRRLSSSRKRRSRPPRHCLLDGGNRREAEPDSEPMECGPEP